MIVEHALTTSLKDSEHHQVEIAFSPSEEDAERLARLTFYGDGQDISLYMFSTDCVTLGNFLLNAVKAVKDE